MSKKDKVVVNSTYLNEYNTNQGCNQNSQENLSSLEDQEDDENIITEKDEDVDNLTCSQFIKQTELSLNKEDIHSTSRFDSDYINNALHEGFNSNEYSKDVSQEEEDEEENNIQEEDYDSYQNSNDANSYQKQVQQDFENQYSMLNKNYKLNSNQLFEQNSQNVSLINKQFAQQGQEEHFQNELIIVKNTNNVLQQENIRLRQEIQFLKQQHQTNEDLIRMQAEYQQIKFDEKVQVALKQLKDKYEGKISNYKEQIKMYQTSIENIRAQYKDKNQKLQDVVARLEQEKQELIDKNIDFIKNKIQNKIIEENNLNNSQLMYSSQQKVNSSNIPSAFNTHNNSQFNNTLNLVNESFENFNFTGSFSKQLAQLKQNQKLSTEKLQDLKVDAICIQSSKNEQQKMDSFIIEKMKDESFCLEYQSAQNSAKIKTDNLINKSNCGSRVEIKNDHQNLYNLNSRDLETNALNSSNSNKNTFQLTRLSKQIKQEEEADASFSVEQNNKISYYDEALYQDKIRKSLHQGESLLQNNQSLNIGRKSEQLSPNNSFNQMSSFSRHIYDKRSYSIDSNILKDQNNSKSFQERTYQDYDSSLSRVQKYQDYFLNDIQALRKKNQLNGNSRKNSISESSVNTSLNNITGQKIQKNNFMKNKTLTINTNSTLVSEKNRRKRSSSQRNSTLGNTNNLSFNNKENAQTNANTANKSSYMKQTQSSKQKKAMYKLPDHLTSLIPSKIGKSNSLEKKTKKSQTTTNTLGLNKTINLINQQKKQQTLQKTKI
ncbi:hypothetical protein TTHERM_00371090 (macronuclear) [Tetrahymena thermophila SB210]|uniref:Uncharacterized protein n=1 Tax=Tetrahymena thermophila (strain SB210) TaxID=312017 RepID=I7M0K6_TETTS|nr:hypothetical protein TTHERM_00371090 [Tetrahymena thermophila SB210]EAR89294.1 hypothetical protein TTHERM_00371090 [Tetrahymena thermophila SB210]|eukprot:XP_001009539.1 hypothetical protein TTHERM_00371090 [Tetrahymena thermophila SB210]